MFAREIQSDELLQSFIARQIYLNCASTNKSALSFLFSDGGKWRTIPRIPNQFHYIFSHIPYAQKLDLVRDHAVVPSANLLLHPELLHKVTSSIFLGEKIDYLTDKMQRHLPSATCLTCRKKMLRNFGFCWSKKEWVQYEVCLDHREHLSSINTSPCCGDLRGPHRYLATHLLRCPKCHQAMNDENNTIAKHGTSRLDVNTLDEFARTPPHFTFEEKLPFEIQSQTVFSPCYLYQILFDLIPRLHCETFHNSQQKKLRKLVTSHALPRRTLLEVSLDKPEALEHLYLLAMWLETGPNQTVVEWLNDSTSSEEIIPAVGSRKPIKRRTLRERPCDDCPIPRRNSNGQRDWKKCGYDFRVHPRPIAQFFREKNKRFNM